MRLKMPDLLSPEHTPVDNSIDSYEVEQNGSEVKSQPKSDLKNKFMESDPRSTRGIFKAQQAQTALLGILEQEVEVSMESKTKMD